MRARIADCTTASAMAGSISDLMPSSTPSSTVSVTVSIRAHLNEPDGTPVTVRITGETHRNVLSVPIT